MEVESAQKDGKRKNGNWETLDTFLFTLCRRALRAHKWPRFLNMLTLDQRYTTPFDALAPMTSWLRIPDQFEPAGRNKGLLNHAPNVVYQEMLWWWCQPNRYYTTRLLHLSTRVWTYSASSVASLFWALERLDGRKWDSGVWGICLNWWYFTWDLLWHLQVIVFGYWLWVMLDSDFRNGLDNGNQSNWWIARYRETLYVSALGRYGNKYTQYSAGTN
jgi:hypothetical protein